MSDIPMQRLTEFAEPNANDLALFRSLFGPEERISRRRDIRTQGDPVQEIFLLSSGWAVSCFDSRGGERQILKLHTPGDVLGAPSLAMETAAETLVAMTEVTIRAMPLSAIGRIFKEAPSLAASLFISAQQERIFLMERLASLGRMPAIKRLAALLLHVHDRLVHIGRERGVVEWPLTQADLADILGLTNVHVNRIMRSLDQQGFIKRKGSTVILSDLVALRRLSGVPQRKWIHGPDWLAQIAL